MKMNEPLVSAIALPLPGADRLSLSVVIPVYNEETGLAALFARLWHHTTRPVMYGCGAALTPFMLKSACQGSASIPLILDEYKPVELGPVRTDLLLQTFRLSYNQAMGATGRSGTTCVSRSSVMCGVKTPWSAVTDRKSVV